MGLDVTFLKRAFGVGEGWKSREHEECRDRTGIMCPKYEAHPVALLGTIEPRRGTVTSDSNWQSARVL